MGVTLPYTDRKEEIYSLSYPWLLDLTLNCYGHHPRLYEVTNEEMEKATKQHLFIFFITSGYFPRGL